METLCKEGGNSVDAFIQQEMQKRPEALKPKQRHLSQAREESEHTRGEKANWGVLDGINHQNNLSERRSAR